MKDREVGDKGSLVTLVCWPGQEIWLMGWGWSVCQKTVTSEDPFVLLGPQILSFHSALTHSDFWSILPVCFPLTQLPSPKRLSPEIVLGFSVALSQRQGMGLTGGVLDLLGPLHPLARAPVKIEKVMN